MTPQGCSRARRREPLLDLAISRQSGINEWRAIEQRAIPAPGRDKMRVIIAGIAAAIVVAIISAFALETFQTSTTARYTAQGSVRLTQ